MESSRGINQKSFCFIINILDVKSDLPFEIIPNHWIEKADKNQIEIIDKFLDENTTFTMDDIPSLYKSEIKKSVIDGGAISIAQKLLPEDKYRYYILSFTGNNSEIFILRNALNLLKNDLDLGFSYYKDPESIIDIHHYQTGTLDALTMARHFCMKPNLKEPTILNIDDLNEIKEIYKAIKENDIIEKHEIIWNALINSLLVKILPPITDLKIVGYFSIIESILTHKPTPCDKNDSILKQINTKIPLIKKYFKREIDYNSYFESENETRIWNTLYNLRSRIAHGNKFNYKKHKTNRLKVMNFFKEFIKPLLIMAIENPAYIKELKER